MCKTSLQILVKKLHRTSSACCSCPSSQLWLVSVSSTQSDTTFHHLNTYIATSKPLLGFSNLAPRAVSYTDPETGFTFSETRAAATLSSNIVYRIAQPANIPANQPYDIVLQVVAPNQLGWVGLAWGGSMIRNPLTVAYPNGQRPTVSSRWATYVSALLFSS